MLPVAITSKLISRRRRFEFRLNRYFKVISIALPE
jgi:hypothetical protein